MGQQTMKSHKKQKEEEKKNTYAILSSLFYICSTTSFCNVPCDPNKLI